MFPQILFVVASPNSVLGHTRKLLLDHAGYRTTVATTSATAVEALTHGQIDLVLVGGTGRDIELGPIVSAVRGQSVPIVVLSRQSSSRDGVISVDAQAGPGAVLHAVGKAIVAAHGHAVKDQDCLMFVNPDRRYIHVTQSAADLLGYRDGELIGRTIDDISAPNMDVPEKFKSYVRDGKQHGVFTLVHRTGQLIPVHYAAEVLHDGCMVSQLSTLD